MSGLFTPEMLPILAAALGAGFGFVRTLLSKDKDAARETLAGEIDTLRKLLSQRGTSLEDCMTERTRLAKQVATLEVQIARMRAGAGDGEE
jgi:hypothetical protein